MGAVTVHWSGSLADMPLSTVYNYYWVIYMNVIAKKNFTNGFVSLLSLTDGMRIETTATCLPLSTEMRGTGRSDNYAVDYNEYSHSHWLEKAMVGVSTQSGCPIKCKFCAVNDLTEQQGWRNLTADEIFYQVEWARKSIWAKHKIDISGAAIFRVLFTRMGEPSLNIENVISAARKLRNTFPNVRIQISTIAFGKNFQKLLFALVDLQEEFGEQFIELQVSIHSTNDFYRQWLQNKGAISNARIGQMLYWYNDELRVKLGKPLLWKVTLNFALTENTPFDMVALRQQFNPDDVFIKVSPINENNQTEKNSIKGVILQTNNI